jgi:hypothetical protein
VNPQVASIEITPKAEPSIVGRRLHDVSQTD